MSVDISFLKNASPRDKGTSLKQKKNLKKENKSTLYIVKISVKNEGKINNFLMKLRKLVILKGIL